jgi:MFS family permease
MTFLSLPHLLASSMPPQLRVVRRPTVPAPMGGAPAPRRSGGGMRGGFAAMRHRNFRLYISGQIVSLIGTWMQSVSQPWLVLLLGGSPLQLATVMALQFAPSLLLAPLGGVLADRIDKRKALMGTQFVAMLETSTLFVLTFTGVVEIWHIYVLALVLGLVRAVDAPVRQSFAAEMVPREDLVNAIALNAATFNAARVVGPAVAGVTLAIWGPAFNFALDGVSYLAVLGALWMMRPEELHRDAQRETTVSVWSSLGEGIRYSWRTPTVRWPLILLAGAAAFGMNFQTLLPLFTKFTLGMGAEGYGALYAAMGVGSLIGSLSLAFAGSRRPLLPLILAGGAAFVVFELLLGLFPVAAVSFPMVVLVGLASMVMVNTINVTVQHGVPHELRGRVMSLYVMVFAGSAPIGGYFAGALAELFGADVAFVFGAIGASFFVALFGYQLFWRGLTVPASRPAPPSVLKPVERVQPIEPAESAEPEAGGDGAVPEGAVRATGSADGPQRDEPQAIGA